MSLPDSHPAVDQVDRDKACPLTGQTYNFSPPQEGDVRSVCPALNTMANHGYMYVILHVKSFETHFNDMWYAYLVPVTEKI